LVFCLILHKREVETVFNQMSVDVAKDKPLDDKQARLTQSENEASMNIFKPISKSSASTNIIQIDEPSFINSNCPNSDKTGGDEKDGYSVSSDVSKITTEISDDPDAIHAAIEKRKQPLMELAYSEESYVRRLRIVYELYMPAPYRSTPPADASTPGMSSVSPALPVSTSGFEELASKLPLGGPVVPEDLVARWRILWGNWMQLFEWHTGFYEKLKALLDEDPDRIPKLFIDSRARLRSIYSKYCENQIKAAHIAEQHKEFFDEWRIFVGDKEDVVSLLMQPVQRIMRYQLPISEIVKWTERAKIPSLPLWQKALDIMKEIPKDTQLILEVSSIFTLIKMK
uniref:DH domain-containing protein n=1 Tax=Rodentolepis nana TaxID=102285 RepID=A0A0R3TQT2_RODNA